MKDSAMADLSSDDGFGPRYPARRLLELMGDKWTPVVLFCLSGSVMRFGEIQRAIPDISKKMLIQVLRALEAGGLVERTVYAVVPPKTEYRLTPDGQTLHGPVASLCEWAGRNEAFLDKVHQRRGTMPNDPATPEEDGGT